MVYNEVEWQNYYSHTFYLYVWIDNLWINAYSLNNDFQLTKYHHSHPYYVSSDLAWFYLHVNLLLKVMIVMEIAPGGMW